MTWSKLEKEVSHLHLDIDLKLKKEQKVCSKGCSFCCYQVIRIFPVEEAPIDKFVDDHLDMASKAFIKQNLEKWLTFYDQNTPEGILSEEDIRKFSLIAATKRLACPFLINRECSIYQVRPLVCRTHYVKDSVELCEKDPLRVGELEGNKVQESAFSALARLGREFSGRESGLRLLPYAIVEKFGIKKKLKPISLAAISVLR